MWAFWKVFFWEKWSLSFLYFLSNEDHSILYESWDVQFRHLDRCFWVENIALFGGAKVKSACCAKLAEFRKTSTILSIFIKTFWIICWWKIWQIGFFSHLIITFGSMFFWLGCVLGKMDDHFQCPLWPISIILTKLATMLENYNWCQLSPKKFEKFWWKLKEYKPYPYLAGTFAPPHPLGLKSVYHLICGVSIAWSGFRNSKRSHSQVYSSCH